jgi:hypothetical protein
LAGNDLGEAGCTALAAKLPLLHALRSLELSGNGIGDAGCVTLTDFLSKPDCVSNLSFLGLSKNNVGESGGYWFFRILLLLALTMTILSALCRSAVATWLTSNESLTQVIFGAHIPSQAA